MKKLPAVLCLALLVTVCATARGKQENIFHRGLNAEIVALDEGSWHLTLKDADAAAGIFGGSSIVDCEEAAENGLLLYCDYETGDLREISFSELRPGGDIILGMCDEELQKLPEGAAKAAQIQLGTQRLN